AMNHREAHRQGNRDDSLAPHGVYPCLGADAWVSIGVGSEAEWQGLKRAMGGPAWADALQFGDAYQRWQNQDSLNAHLAEWTGSCTPEEVTHRLRQEGVAASPSLAADQLMSDPHLLARDAFPTVEHTDKGRQRTVAPPWQFSGTPAAIDKWTPDLGEHNMEVFHGLLGLAMDEVEALMEAQVIW
ncbi:MAG: CoA transferase, partial [Dehalococcoidia bacterium]